MSVHKVTDKVWKITCGSNVYFLDLDEKILIDTGERSEHATLKTFLTKLTVPEKIDKVIFTHLHYDHIGNFDMFRNAKFYASLQERRDLAKDAYGCILDEDMVEKFRHAGLDEARDTRELKIINTPGHTRGSICIWYEKEKVLFSGDTIFDKGLGRTDLPTSAPEKMQETVLKLLKLNHKILCPGHDY